MTSWIESDSYDRAAFAALKADSPSLQELEASGARLLPHFDGFLLDLFALLFKLNIVMRAEEDAPPSAFFYRFLLEQIRMTPAIEILRQRTTLDEAAAGLATLLLAERLLELLKSERILTRAEMLDYWNVQQQVEDIADRADQARSADELQEKTAGRLAERQLAELRNRLERENDAAMRRLQHQSRRMWQALQDGADRHRPRLESALNQSIEDFETAREGSESWNLHLGSGQSSSPGRQIELGSRLARSRKLKHLAQLVGRMKATARALRRKMTERANAELYEIGASAELSHLLPVELLSLRHPRLRRDFERRLLERQLLVYDLRAEGRRGRGPMIVCLDGSSSMAGEKEIWSKAVTLTLLDLARRQRRRFRSICFSSAETPLQIVDFETQGYSADLRQVFDIAEYFPGGGTDFQKPLSAAVECLRRRPLKRGDIVLITDGECRVDPQWLGDFKAQKEQLGFSLFSVLIDIGPSSLGALKELSDRVTSVSRLTGEGPGDIFLNV